MADDATIDQIATQIAGIESGGKYDILGPVTDKGDRAHGKYQIMGANIPSWTREALGEEYDPQRFLADPDAQEKTARFKMGQYFDQYGTPEDVASMWHSGLPYSDAVAKGRKDQLGTTTENYGARVRSGVGGVAAAPQGDPLIVVLPDGRRVNLGVNPSAELRAQVKAKIRTMFPDLGMTPPATTDDTGAVAPPTPVAQEPLPAESPTLSVEQPWRDLSVDEAGMEMNTAMGFKPDHPYGKYASALGKPIADALTDVYDVFTKVEPGQTGDPADPTTWMDGLNRAVKLLHPLGVPAEAAGNVVFQALTDSGASPEIAGAAATLAFAGASVATPVPGLAAKVRPAMPLQGTAATRAAAADATAAVGQADEAVTAARAAEEAAVSAGDTATSQAGVTATTARATAEDAARQAEAAAGVAAPGPDAAARAQAALAPRGGTATEGSAAVASQLERELAEVKDPVQGIYNNLVARASAEGRALDPITYAEGQLPQQLKAIREELGATLTGQSKKVIDTIDALVKKGEAIPAEVLDQYKAQLDSLFPGRLPHGSSPRTKALYDFKWDVRDMARSMYDGEEKQWAETADALWRDTIIGKDSPTALGNLARLAKKNPQTFVERVFGAGTADKQGVYAQSVMKHLDDATKTQLREATLSRAIDAATDATTDALDPAKLLTTIGKYNKAFKDAIITPEVDAFLKLLRQEQAAVGETATAARRGAQWATAAEREAAQVATEGARDVTAAGRAISAAERGATKATKAAEAASSVAAEPNKLAKLTALGIEIGGAALAHGAGVPAAIIGGGLGASRMTQFLIPRTSIAKALADSKTANLIVRAMRTPLDSKGSIAVINALKNRGTSVGFLGDNEESEK